MSGTRFFPMLQAGGFGSWASPQVTLALDGEPFAASILNLVSPDFLPVELEIVESVEATSTPGWIGNRPAGGGIINLVLKPIPDSLTVTARVFTGGETGDPLLYKFTRPELNLINKNKVNFSGGLSLANSVGKTGYRVSAGTFGYFISGSSAETDQLLLRLNPELSYIQNRDTYASAEINSAFGAAGRLTGYFGLLNSDGWQMPPFTSQFGLFNTTLTTFRVHVDEIGYGVSVFLKRDGVSAMSSEILLTPSGSFSLSEYLLSPRWTGTLTAGVTLRAQLDIAQRYAESAEPRASIPRQFFDRNLSSSELGLGFGIDAALSSALRYSVRVRLEDKPAALRRATSTEVLLRYEPENDFRLRIGLGSYVYLPNLFETHGSYVTMRDITVSERETFMTSGTETLLPQRSTGVNVEYSRSLGRHESSMTISGFWYALGRPIQKRIQSAVRTDIPGDIVRDAIYVNAGGYHTRGAGFGLQTIASDKLLVSFDYQFIDNSFVPHIAKHALASTAHLTVAKGSMFRVSGYLLSSRTLNEFAVSPQNDDTQLGGTNGKIAGKFVVDASFTQRLVSVLFLREVALRVEFQNIFDQKYRQLPVGSALGRAGFIYLSIQL